MNRNKAIALATLALTACVATAFGQSSLWSDDFSNPTGWASANSQISYPSQQCALSQSFGPTPSNNPPATFGYAWHAIPTSGALLDNQTLEVRVDVVSANQNDAWADVAFLWMPDGRAYHFFMDQDEVGLLKGSSTSFCFFFWENPPLKTQNVTVVLALTRRGSDLEINTRILDKDAANAVLFERTVTDTPQADPVLPSGTVKGFVSSPDAPEPPWPVVGAPGNVVLGLPWANPASGTQGAAEVIYDNLEVRQYESPELTVHNAVVLSWPVTQGQFVLESAVSANGPWELVPDPWCRTNAAQMEVCIPAPDSMKLFRLRLAP